MASPEWSRKAFPITSWLAAWPGSSGAPSSRAVSALPPALAGTATSLNAALNSILASAAVQNTVSVGTRWDVVKNVDLKLQYDHSRLGAHSPGVLTNIQPGFQPGGTVNLLSITLDFLW